MRRFNVISFGLWLCVCLAGGVRADTFQLLDGTTVEGEIIPPPTPDNVNLKIGTGKYQRIAWTNFSQTALQEFAKNPKFAPFVDPFIEVTIEERIKKTEPPKITEPTRLALPRKGSLFGALTGSSVGLVCLLLLYAANIYAGYEISVIRAYPAAMVCGISAILPVIGPIIFLSMPTKLKSQQEEVMEEIPAEAAPVAEPTPEEAAQAAGGLSLAAREHAAPALPEAQVFKRGQFTFNRRFIETKFSGFFGIARREAEKDMVLLIKAARGEHIATRISRITANDMHIEVRKGPAFSEIQIPFVEITEIHLKHKDA